MATLSTIAVHPIKALEPTHPDEVSITSVGGLAGDREYAMVDADGEYLNGKRTADVHPVRAEYDLDERRVTLGIEGEGLDQECHLDDDRAAVEAWLSNYFDVDLELEVAQGGSQTDSVIYGDGTETGPTLLSEATLREVSSWYDGIGPDEMRLRLRPNLVVEGVPAFWEDKLFADGGRGFRIGDVEFEGVKPIPRCVVPTRNPHTGETYEGFQETFIREREASLPKWTDREAFEDHVYKLMAVARVPKSERDGTISVGDPVELLDE